MGGLLDDIRQEVRAGRGPQCPIAVLLTALPDKDAADLRAALDDRAVTGAAIYRALKARGHAASEGGIGNHRRGACSCDKAG